MKTLPMHLSSTHLQLRPGEMFFMIRPLGKDSPIAEPIGATVSQGDSIQLGDLSLTFVRESVSRCSRLRATQVFP